MIHYLCLTSYIPNTSKEQVCDTTEFFPRTPPLSTMSSEGAATHADADLTHELLIPNPTIPFTIIGNKQTAVLNNHSEIFNMAATLLD